MAKANAKEINEKLLAFLTSQGLITAEIENPEPADDTPPGTDPNRDSPDDLIASNAFKVLKHLGLSDAQISATVVKATKQPKVTVGQHAKTLQAVCKILADAGIEVDPDESSDLALTGDGNLDPATLDPELANLNAHVVAYLNKNQSVQAATALSTRLIASLNVVQMAVGQRAK
jgi:hypothetical protein